MPNVATPVVPGDVICLLVLSFQFRVCSSQQLVSCVRTLTVLCGWLCSIVSNTALLAWVWQVCADLEFRMLSQHQTKRKRQVMEDEEYQGNVLECNNSTLDSGDEDEQSRCKRQRTSEPRRCASVTDSTSPFILDETHPAYTVAPSRSLGLVPLLCDLATTEDNIKYLCNVWFDVHQAICGSRIDLLVICCALHTACRCSRVCINRLLPVDTGTAFCCLSTHPSHQ
jgi:hypothetical protein